MAIQFRKAERRKAKARVALSGPSGSGKTYSSLLMAFGLASSPDKVALIDTESGSGELYAHLGDYAYAALEAPFTPQKYIEAIKAAEDAGFEVIIIDSLSHAWAGQGGMLDLHDKATAKTGNSFTAWRNVTPLHNQLVDTILGCKAHVIATLRAKTEYVVEKNGDKTNIRKVGLAPVFRDGIEYEFTIFFDLLQTEHTAAASKDRTGLFDGQYCTITQETGQKLREWLESGTDAPIPPPATTQAEDEELKRLRKQFFAQARETLGNADSDMVKEWIKSLYGAESFLDISPEDLRKTIIAMKNGGAERAVTSFVKFQTEREATVSE